MKELIEEEEQRLRKLRFVVDLTCSILMQSDMTFQEARFLLSEARKAAMALFPDKADVYDLIYAPRFRRILAERFLIYGKSCGQ
ncbi:MAG: hypothetical protein HZC12_00295 [Nitrospirae bacterium]|nr:hypothetical protein [Nitrospirota bacterium]